jgi:hypothetical protein
MKFLARGMLAPSRIMTKKFEKWFRSLQEIKILVLFGMTM